MTQYDMSGILFRNNRKEKPSQPDYYGDCTINGVKFKIASWIKEGKKGKFMSLRFEDENVEKAYRKTPEEHQQNPDPRPPAPPGDLDDDIPF